MQHEFALTVRMITDQIVRQTTNVLNQIHAHTLASRYKIKNANQLL